MKQHFPLPLLIWMLGSYGILTFALFGKVWPLGFLVPLLSLLLIPPKKKEFT